MMKISAVFICLLLTVISGSQVDKRRNQKCSGKKTSQCLVDVISCLSHNPAPKKEFAKKIKSLEKQIEDLKSLIKTKSGKPNGLASLDAKGHLLQKVLPAGYDKRSASDIQWQSLHMAAAAACRGSTASGGTGCCDNIVLVRNTASRKTCAQLCAKTWAQNCDAEVSVGGIQGKATQNGQIIGHFYNYGCHSGSNGGSEASDPTEDIFANKYAYYSFCCCRK